MKRVRVAADQWNFETGPGEFISPIGGNILDDVHPVERTLFRDFDAADCDRRLGIMADAGLNCLRQAIGVNEAFDPGTRQLKAAGLKNWDTFIRLAERHGIYLMPVGGYIGGNDWFDSARLADSGAQLDLDCRFWELFCGHFRDHPAIWAWDLRNELLYWSKLRGVVVGKGIDEPIDAMLKDRWPQWLQTRYGSVEAMNRAYNASHQSFEAVPGSVEFVEEPFDLCAYDFRCYLNDRGYDWCKRQCDVIRSVAPDQMIVSGNNAWLSPDQNLFLANGFHSRATHDLFDFVTFHPYPAWQAVPGYRGDPLDYLKTAGDERHDSPLWYWLHSCIGNARMDCDFNKPVVIQEFGWYGGGTSKFLGSLPHRSEEEHAEYTEIFIRTLAPHVNGFINWPTFDMPAATDISNHGGIFTCDGKRKALTKVYERASEQLKHKRHTKPRGTTTLAFSLLGIYTCRSYQDQMWDRVHEVLRDGDVPEIRFI